MVNIQPLSAFGYLLRVLHLMTQPGIRRYVWIPLLIKYITVLYRLFYLLFHRFDIAMHALTAWLPDWLDWLTFYFAVGSYRYFVCIQLFYSAWSPIGWRPL